MSIKRNLITGIEIGPLCIPSWGLCQGGKAKDCVTSRLATPPSGLLPDTLLLLLLIRSPSAFHLGKTCPGETTDSAIPSSLCVWYQECDWVQVTIRESTTLD